MSLVFSGSPYPERNVEDDGRPSIREFCIDVVQGSFTPRNSSFESRFICEFDTVERSNLSLNRCEKKKMLRFVFTTQKSVRERARRKRYHEGKDEPAAHIKKLASFVLSRRATRTDELRNFLSRRDFLDERFPSTTMEHFFFNKEILSNPKPVWDVSKRHVF